ncbi:RNI-like protein [Hortaea werneckii]|uniref:F-box domain-containing protein n=1 Tax=Hortaea werneckii TaxID=91943 RepID=A0A3M7FYH4_HORWE|nr:RNI-like protein [Hortaea werneckii]RMY93922.1 hypothetical protein D0861_01656 [Hortaea werneckii]
MASNNSSDSIGDSHTPIGSPQSATVAPPPYTEQPQQRLKGRQRLMAGLQRMSSSQSLGRLSKTRSRGYSAGGKASASCISLHSTQSLNSPSLGQTLNSELATAYATAPTSATNTPGMQIPMFDERARWRSVSNLDAKTSAGLPTDVRPTTRSGLTPGIAEVDEDYFSRPVTKDPKPSKPQRDFNFWRDLPSELKMQVLMYFQPKEIVRCSVVSKGWHKMCFDGQLWSNLDAADFYQDIPADCLARIITSAGPFVRDLNLRGCVQLRDQWHIAGLSDACRNVENISLEGCKVDKTTIHNFLYSNSKLVHINLSGLAGATNSAMKILAQNCPRLEHLNVSWCNNIDTKGLKMIVEGCTNIRDLRAGEIRGWDDVDVMQALFERNTLERLIMMNCDSLTDDSLKVLMVGQGSEIDYLTGRAIVPPRRFKHLDFTRCRGITDQGLKSMVGNVPYLEGLQLSKCGGVVDATLTELIPTTPSLTHLDLEELEDLTNEVLLCLSNAPCAERLRHLSISYCEHMGDTGMVPLVKSAINLQSLEMDNTRISDLVLTEAAAMMRTRIPRTVLQGKAGEGYAPSIGLKLVAYDCQNVTWTGVREVLFRNAEVYTTTHTTELPPLEKNSKPATPAASANASSESLHTQPQPPARTPTPPRIHITRTSSFPSEIIQLKCFYTYQPTAEEHTKRVLRGDFVAARRLERKWAEFMIAQEEAGAAGAGSRRRRRRAREAQMMHADEHQAEDDGVPAGTMGGVGGGRRRRARSGGCAVM